MQADFIKNTALSIVTCSEENEHQNVAQRKVPMTNIYYYYYYYTTNLLLKPVFHLDREALLMPHKPITYL